jgi:hypothetical protein
MILTELGLNKCSKCGYDLCIAALDFHHENPALKDFSLAEFRRQSPTIKNVKKFKEEASKGQVLCANCHRELHFGNPYVLDFFRSTC